MLQFVMRRERESEDYFWITLLMHHSPKSLLSSFPSFSPLCHPSSFFRPVLLHPFHPTALLAVMSWLFLDWFVPLYLLVSVLVLAGFGACLYFLEPGLQDAHKWSNKTVRHHPLVASVNCRDDDSNALIWSRGRGGMPSGQGCCQDTGGVGANTLKMEKENRREERRRRGCLIMQALPYHSDFSLISVDVSCRDQGKVKIWKFFKHEAKCTRRRRLHPDRDGVRWLEEMLPFRTVFEPDVYFIPSYTCANFYIRFVIWQSLYIYHEVYLYCAFK